MAPSAEVILMRTQAALLSCIHASHETNRRNRFDWFADVPTIKTRKTELRPAVA